MFSKGPFRTFGPDFDARTRRVAAARVTYTLEWEPRTLVGRLFGAKLAAQAGDAIEKRVLTAVALREGRAAHHVRPAVAATAGRRARARAIARWREQVDRSTYGNGLGAPIADYVHDRHGVGPRAHQAQAAGAPVRRDAAARDRGLPCRR